MYKTIYLRKNKWKIPASDKHISHIYPCHRKTTLFYWHQVSFFIDKNQKQTAQKEIVCNQKPLFKTVKQRHSIYILSHCNTVTWYSFRLYCYEYHTEVNFRILHLKVTLPRYSYWKVPYSSWKVFLFWKIIK